MITISLYVCIYVYTKYSMNFKLHIFYLVVTNGKYLNFYNLFIKTPVYILIIDLLFSNSVKEAKEQNLKHLDGRRMNLVEGSN